MNPESRVSRLADAIVHYPADLRRGIKEANKKEWVIRTVPSLAVPFLMATIGLNTMEGIVKTYIKFSLL